MVPPTRYKTSATRIHQKNDTLELVRVDTGHAARVFQTRAYFDPSEAGSIGPVSVDFGSHSKRTKATNGKPFISKDPREYIITRSSTISMSINGATARVAIKFNGAANIGNANLGLAWIHDAHMGAAGTRGIVVIYRTAWIEKKRELSSHFPFPVMRTGQNGVLVEGG